MSHSEELVTIPGEPRTQVGKGHNRKLRAKGFIPANIIGKGQAEMISIDPKWLSKAWLGPKKFKLDMSGHIRTVSIKELQINPVKRIPLHVDLMLA